MADVLVIGGGMAGVLAALTAREQGANVTLASRSFGATAFSTGAIDVAYSPALSPAMQTPRTVAEHILDIVAHRPRHPYGILGVERSVRGIRVGFARLRKALAPAGLAPPELSLEAENLGLPSSLGAAVPAASALASHIGVDLHRGGVVRLGVVELRGLADFDGRRLGVGWRRDATSAGGGQVEVQRIQVAAPGAEGPMAVARAFDELDEVDTLGRALAAQSKDVGAFVVPPVIGLDGAGSSMARLREVAGRPVVEALAHVPSVPGVRLQRALHAALDAVGVRRIGEVTQPLVRAGALVGMRSSSGEVVHANAFVLASGRFVAGGVVWSGAQCREALFDLPVVAESGPLEVRYPLGVLDAVPMGSHSLMTAGVAVDGGLRPLLHGTVAFDNLFAAGMVIGGFASRFALCADGVAMASGVEAGEAAAARAGRAS